MSSWKPAHSPGSHLICDQSRSVYHSSTTSPRGQRVPHWDLFTGCLQGSKLLIKSLRSNTMSEPIYTPSMIPNNTHTLWSQMSSGSAALSQIYDALQWSDSKERKGCETQDRSQAVNILLPFAVENDRVKYAFATCEFKEMLTWILTPPGSGA